MAIMDDTVDKKVAKNLDRDDMVTTTMSTFVSSTVHCARCHNHKFDPISQEDYYSLQAVFAGVDRANRPYDPDQKTHQARQALLKKKASPASDEELARLAAAVLGVPWVFVTLVDERRSFCEIEVHEVPFQLVLAQPH